MNRPFAISASALLLSLAFAPTGCAAPDEGEEASATATSALQAQSQDGVMDTVLDTEGDVAPAPEDVAARVESTPSRFLSPSGCATKRRDGNVVTLSLDGCTGPFGRVTLHGELVATFSRSSTDVLHVDVVAKDLDANGRPLAYAAQADVRFDGTQRFVSYAGQSEGTTKRGRDMSRQTQLSIVVDTSTHCASIDGTSKGSVGSYAIDLSIDGFRDCRDACPTAGHAHATVDGPGLKNAAIDVTFDGSSRAHAKVSARKTRELDVPLDCAASEAE